MDYSTGWNWDKDTANNFDNHIKSQLIWYDLMTDIVKDIAQAYLPQNGTFYDIGCGIGNISRALKPILKSRNIMSNSIDSSESMIYKFKGYGGFHKMKIEDFINDKDFLSNAPNLVTCVLSLMFVPVPERENVVSKIREMLKQGGAAIFVERCLPEKIGYFNLVMQRILWKQKRENDVCLEDIVDKEISLMGVQIPVNPDLFKNDYEFFRIGDFRGWIIEKK